MNQLKKIIFICFLLISFNVSQAQNYIPYYNARNESLHQYHLGQYKKAEALLDQAFRAATPLPGDLYYAAILNAQLNEAEACKKILEAGLKAAPPIITEVTSADSLILIKVLAESDIARYQKDYSINSQFYTQQTGLEAEKQDSINARFIKEDQRYRSEMNDAEKYEQDKLKNDAETQRLFVDYIRINGWPKYNTSGLNTILQHLTRENYIMAKPILLSEVKSGKLDPFYYAWMVEKLENQYNGRAVTYDFIHYKGPFSKEVIANRKSIGLSIYNTSPLRKFDQSK